MNQLQVRTARRVWMLATAFSSLLGVACQRQVEVGQAKFLEEPQATIDAGVSKGLMIEVKNPGDVALEFRWAALRGGFHTATTKASSNVYRAPVEPGPDTITIDVLGGGAPVQRTLQVDVNAPATGVPAASATKEFTYTFDAGTEGWAPNQSAGTAGLVRLAHSSTERVGAKGGSLQLELDLDGRTPRKATAEVEVNLTHAGAVVSDPFDLSGRTIVFYVKFPPDFPIRTDAPHGVQPFAKDENHRNYYGCYRDIDVAGKWIRVTFQPGPPARLPCAADTKAWQQDQGFAAARVTVIGLKIGANAANRAYHGPAFLDDVTLGQ